MMKSLLWAALCLLFVSAVVLADSNNKDDDEDDTPPCPDYDEFKVEQLVNYLVLDKDMAKFASVNQALSASYRNSMIRAVARYLANSNDLSNLKGPDGHRKFETAWAKLKALCFQLKGINERGITPKHLREDNLWESLTKVVQYIINSKMLLPDEVFSHLRGGKRSG